MRLKRSQTTRNVIFRDLKIRSGSSINLDKHTNLRALTFSHGLAQKVGKIPRACPVESHVCRYKNPKIQVLKMPRACPVEPHVCCYLAENVNLHGARPWHPVYLLKSISVANSVILHGASPWHLRLFVQALSHNQRVVSYLTTLWIPRKSLLSFTRAP